MNSNFEVINQKPNSIEIKNPYFPGKLLLIMNEFFNYQKMNIKVIYFIISLIHFFGRIFVKDFSAENVNTLILSKENIINGHLVSKFY